MRTGSSLRRAALLLLMAATGCSLPFGLAGSDDRDVLRAHEQRWVNRGYESYDLVIERICFCGPIGPVRISVRDGAVTARVVVETGEPLIASLAPYYPGVPGLFDIVDDAIDRNAASLEVRYDDALGVPMEIEIDYRENVIDEELTVVVRSLERR